MNASRKDMSADNFEICNDLSQIVAFNNSKEVYIIADKGHYICQPDYGEGFTLADVQTFIRNNPDIVAEATHEHVLVPIATPQGKKDVLLSDALANVKSVREL